MCHAVQLVLGHRRPSQMFGIAATRDPAAMRRVRSIRGRSVPILTDNPGDPLRPPIQPDHAVSTVMPVVWPKEAVITLERKNLTRQEPKRLALRRLGWLRSASAPHPVVVRDAHSLRAHGVVARFNRAYTWGSHLEPPSFGTG